MKSVFKIEIFTLIIFFIFSLYGYAHIYENLYINEYSFNELFINYQAGFVRRGLLGEIFWHINLHYNIDPRVFLVIFFTFYTLLKFFFYI